jgi:hypothetical protein
MTSEGTNLLDRADVMRTYRSSRWQSSTLEEPFQEISKIQDRRIFDWG